MKKQFVSSVLFALVLSSCSRGHSSSLTDTTSSLESEVSSPAPTYEMTIQGEVGVYSPNAEYYDKATYMLCRKDSEVASMLFPEEACGTDFSSLLPGDLFEVDLKYPTPYMIVPDSMPSSYPINEEQVVEERVSPCTVIEIELREGEIVPVDGIDFSKTFLEEAIAEDGSLVSLPSLTRGYATISALYPGLARAIYAYNPRG